MVKYVLKRIALMFFVFFTILTVCFVLVKLLPLVDAKQFGKDMNLIQQRREALGYNKPILIQYLIFLKRSVIEFKYSWPTPGTPKIVSIIRDPPKIPTNSPKIIGNTGTMEFLIAWRIVACERVKPFVLASSIKSLVNTSESSARTYLARLAILPNANASTAGMTERNIDSEK